MEEDEPMGEDEPMDEEHIQEKESDGLEEFWNEYSVALESSKLDTLEEAANEKEVNNVCNHEIQIHEDLGHVCRVCGMIVREGLTQSLIIDGERIVEELNALDIVIHPRHEKQIRSHQLAGFHFLVKNLVSDKPGGCILAHAPEILEVDAADRAFSLIDVTVDSLVRSINVADGVKASLFTNILALVESAVEKVIAFSQYITSHEFFEKSIG
ncbi:unnamed protein product [Triticum turgidum subsp. durum]|uniref:Uncharacterized protein n=1 Tax=Triticum turgidum subsp. durum TaxID=4567 RepID=A0A9R0TX40_TRITD|nr:unnamed protein product [Triticum turgidum subsp. durum]